MEDSDRKIVPAWILSRVLAQFDFSTRESPGLDLVSSRVTRRGFFSCGSQSCSTEVPCGFVKILRIRGLYFRIV